MNLKGWAGYPTLKTSLFISQEISEIQKKISEGRLIARGNGRSYGDSAIGEVTTVSMKNFNKIIFFDENTGELIAQAGMLLKDVIKNFLPHGWFPYVTPGSKFVTIGGMVAANVHGKNQHKDGCLINFINWIEIINSEGQLLKCSRNVNSELFNWTVGGMGLTGIIVNVSLTLKKVETSWIKQKILITKNLEQTIDLIENNLNYSYSVAWIDSMKKGNSLGRSIIFLGEHAKIVDLKKKNQKTPLYQKKNFTFKVPFNFPDWVINKFSLYFLNWFIYWQGFFKRNKKIVEVEKFFYPLDNISNWNKVYGHKGFIQYQCVLPLSRSKEGLREIFSYISKKNIGSFISTLKRFGKDFSNISFPMEGYSLCIDLKLNNKTLDAANELDQIVLKYSGRFYLAKDSRISAKIFHLSDKRFVDFINFRKKNKLDKKFISNQSKRLQI